MVKRGELESVVFGVVVADQGLETRIGVSRSLEGKREIRVGGESVSKASELARLLPVLVLAPDTIDLLLGSPQLRRKFLNWGVFHVKHTFTQEWETANRCLKHRNRLLKMKREPGELKVWTASLVTAAEMIDEYRREYFQGFSAQYTKLISDFTDFGSSVSCEYVRGWDESKSLEDVYANAEESDLRRGFTQSGFHKADIKLSIAGQPVTEVCSRGELKMLAWAMILTQGKMQSEFSNQNAVYLVDDIVSELDLDHRQMLCKTLIEMQGQVMATGIDQKGLEDSWNGYQAEVFHVKQGVLSAQSGSVE